MNDPNEHPASATWVSRVHTEEESVLSTAASYIDPDVVTVERARQVRTWRASEGESWRGIAERATDEWGIDYGSNQLCGMALCLTAALRLGEDGRKAPWN